ncbi:MAG TPA: polysaccharide biosynthesis tyrosine autokinase [Anaerolineales bacterium]|nr:polysaccharide biosynthesis tyrosine autokinase [Anaerolineales bacterium]
MELKQYFSIFRRWAWLLVVGLTWGVAAGFFGSNYQTPVYQASTRALVMRPPLEQSSDMTYYSDLQLVQTYIQLLTTQPVLDATAARLGYPVSKGQIKIAQTGDTHVLVVTVEDASPQRAADIANVLLAVMVEQNELLQKTRFATTEESIQAQITQVESQIESLEAQVDSLSTQSLQSQLTQVETQIKPLEAEVSTLQQEIAALEAAASSEQAKRVPDAALVQANKTQVAEKQARIDQIQPLLSLYQEIYSNLVVLGKPVESGSNGDSRMTRLQATLDLYQSLYTSLLSSLETVRLARLQNTPNIVQIEPASVPRGPIRPRPMQNTALGGAIGLMLAAGIAFLFEYLDDTLKTPEDVERVLGLPVLGFVAQLPSKKGAAEEIIVARQPRAPVSEAFRTLRTNLEFAAVEKPICTILVTSPGPSEGKTTVAANLAAIYSQAKKRVLLLDADMRRPRIHQMLGMSNRSGLSNLFLGYEQRESLGRGRPDLPNLLVVTSGGQPPNPAELLGSARMDQILSQLRQHVEVVIIDTPPSLVADAQILAGKVDAVLLVIQPGKTQAGAARACLETLRRSGARIVGVVMNRIPLNRSYYYGGYQYYASRRNQGYYSSDKAEQPGQEPAPVPAQEAAAGPLQKLIQSQTELPAGKREPHTQPSASRAAAEPEEDYADESFLEAPSVHHLFEDLDVAPNAAPLKTTAPSD